MHGRQQWAYCAPVLPVSFLLGPFFIVQGVYGKYFGVDLADIALVLLVSRIFDGLTDPVIGYLSDSYFKRTGTRKPIVLAGGVMITVCSWFLLVPAGYDVSTNQGSVSVVYFCGWFMAFYLAYTLFEIPHLAWGGSIAETTSEKNTVYASRLLFCFVGTLIFYLVPFLPWFTTTEYTPQTLQWTAGIAVGIMLPCLYICLKYAPEKIEDAGKSRSRYGHRNYALVSEKLTVTGVLGALAGNRPFCTLIAGQIATGIGSSMYFAMLYFIVDSYLGMGAFFPLAVAGGYVVGIVSLRPWRILADKTGRKQTLVIGMAVVTTGLLALATLEPSATARAELIIYMSLISSGFAAYNIMVPSLISDISEYGEWQSGVSMASTYFSFYTLLNKGVAALGGALSLLIASGFGFDPTEVSHSQRAEIGLQLATSYVPAVFIFISILFFWQIRLTENHLVVIRKKLARYGSGI